MEKEDDKYKFLNDFLKRLFDNTTGSECTLVEVEDDRILFEINDVVVSNVSINYKEEETFTNIARVVIKELEKSSCLFI